MLPPINFFLLIIQGAIFLLVLAILNKTLFGPILRVLHQREDRTEGFLKKSEEIEEETEKSVKSYNEKLRQAKKEALELRRKYILESTKKKEVLVGNARKEATLYLEEMKEKLREETESTRKMLLDQIEALGRGIAEKVLGRSIGT